MRRVLAIRTADGEFGEQLAKSFNKDTDPFFQTFVFSEQESFIEFAKINRINVLLCDEEIMKRDMEGMKDIGAELMLSLSEVNVAEECCEVHSIFKYQASEAIMKEILFYYDKLKGNAVPNSKTDLTTQKVSCICSPIGGAFSSTFALALAYYYARNGKTLFISFDPFFTLPGRDKDPKDKDLTDVLFFICSNEEHPELKSKIADFIGECSIKRDNLEMLIGVSHWFDLCDMSIESMHTILECTCGNGRYQYVVFDLGIFGVAGMELLLVSDNIYVPVNDTFSGRKKVEEWKRQIRFSGKDTILSKTKELRIPIDPGLKGEYDFSCLVNGTLGKFMAYYKL